MEFSGLAKLSVIFSIALFLAIPLLLFPFPALSQSPPPEIAQGESWDRSCSQGTCTLNLYSFEKYFYNHSTQSFETVNENWFSCGQNFCTRDYHFKLKASPNGNLSFSSPQGDFSYRLLGMLGNSPSAPVISGSRLIYPLGPPGQGIRLEYQFLPSRVKESIILTKKLPNLPAFNVSYNLGGKGFLLVNSTICDDNFRCISLNSSISGNTLNLQGPLAFLNDPETAYPVTIDPTIILNGTQDVLAEEHINHDAQPTCNPGVDCLDYNRIGEDVEIQNLPVGRSKSSPASQDIIRSRAYLSWNITQVPQNADVQEINMTLNVARKGNNGNTNITIFHMERNNTQYNANTTGDYPPTCPGPGTGGNSQGNCFFFMDVGNGTAYNNSIILAAGENRTFNLSSSIVGFEAALASRQLYFSYGIFSFGETNTTQIQTATQFTSSQSANPGTRPRLTITYFIPANESQGRQAIEHGINSSLPNNPIQTDQQVYLLNQNDQQFLGTFDKSTQLNNQTWAFNYVTQGESFTLMPSLFRILNIWEDQTLPPEDITFQVSLFINQTKE